MAAADRSAESVPADSGQLETPAPDARTPKPVAPLSAYDIHDAPTADPHTVGAAAGGTTNQTTTNQNRSISPLPMLQTLKKINLQPLPTPYPHPSPHKPSPGFLRWLQACHKLKLLPKRLLVLHWDELLDLEYPLTEDPQTTEMEEMEEVEEILNHALLGALEADLLEEEGTQEITREEPTN